MCFLCDPKVREKGRLWCKEHDRYEDRCFLCHLELKDNDRIFCDKHNLYLDECFFCQPNLGAKTEKQKVKTVLQCNEHRVEEMKCGICQPQLAADLDVGDYMKIRFVSKKSAEKAGVKTILPELSNRPQFIKAYCETSYNKNKMAFLIARAPSVVKKVMVDLGNKVQENEVIAYLESAEISAAKQAFLISIAQLQVDELTVEREANLFKEKISAHKDYLLAHANKEIAVLVKQGAYQKLKNYGFSEDEIKKIELQKDSSSMLPIRAPFAGTITNRSAVIGQAVIESESLFTIVNLDEMWLDLSITSSSSHLISKDQKIEINFGSDINDTLKGAIIWVSTSIDEQTRMFKARGIIANSKGKLKAGIFGEAKIFISQAQKKYLVPKDSLQIFEGKSYLFVKKEDDLYELRRVEIGQKDKATVEILDGITNIDQIVYEGTFTVMSEYLKSKLGAGCVDD